jgi:hypothetical protein
MIRSALLAATAMSLLAGCSIYQNPEVRVGEASLTERSSEAIRIDIPVELSNPNQEPLDLLRFTYRFAVDGRTVFQGMRAGQATLSARGERRLVLPAIVRFDAVDWDAGSMPESLGWSVSGSLLYLTPGEIAETLLDLGVRKPTTGFRGRGEIALGPPLGPATD